MKELVYLMLSERLNKKTDIFGQLPVVLENVWNKVEINERVETEKIIDNVPKVHLFKRRYKNGVKNIDWESYQSEIDKKEMRKYFQVCWN